MSAPKYLADGTCRLRLSRWYDEGCAAAVIYFTGNKVSVALESRGGIRHAHLTAPISTLRIRTYEIQVGALRVSITEEESGQITRALEKHVGAQVTKEKGVQS